MLRKISALLATVLLIGIEVACMDSGNITTITSEKGGANNEKEETVFSEIVEPDNSENESNYITQEIITQIEKLSTQTATYYFANGSIIDEDDWFYYYDNNNTSNISKNYRTNHGIMCTVNGEWCYDKNSNTYLHNSGFIIPYNDLELYTLYYIPHGSFSNDTIDISRMSAQWFNEDVLLIEKHHNSSNQIYGLFLIPEFTDGVYDCLGAIRLDTAQFSGELNTVADLILSLSFEKCPKLMVSNALSTVYQLDSSALLIMSNDREYWIFDDYISDGGFKVFSQDDGKLVITVFKAPNSYQVLLDPITHKVSDPHVNQNQLDNRLKIDAGYISSANKQYVNGSAEAWYLYNDRMIYANDITGDVIHEEVILLHTSEPLGADRELFFEKVIDAITFFNPHTISQHWEIAATGCPYFLTENTPFYTLETLRYYLSCLFTKESVDYLISRTYQIDEYEYPYLLEDENGLIYFLLISDSTQTLFSLGFMTDEHIELGGALVSVPVYTDTMTLVKEDGYWKCDLSGVVSNRLRISQ